MGGVRSAGDLPDSRGSSRLHLRQAGVSLWIKAGVHPVEVASHAGHSVAVLFRFYAKFLRAGAITPTN